MGKKLYDEENIRAIADALRSKCGTYTTYKCCDMAAAINNLAIADTTTEDSLICSWSKPLTTYENDRVGELRSFAFAGCYNLTSINLSKVGMISQYCFFKDTKLENVDLPAASVVDMYGFAECTKLTNINLPSATSIGMYAFNKCSALTTIDLAATSGVLSSISMYAFYETNLTTLIIRSNTMSSTHASAFGFTPIESGTGYIYVPRALIDTYKADANWSIYANQFRALEDYTVDGTITGALDTTKIQEAN